MPNLIVSKASNPKDGEINQEDLAAIIGAFQDVEVRSSTHPVVKIDRVSIPALLVKHLLEKIPGDLSNACININFGVTLPDQKDCTDGTTDVSNHLTVALAVEYQGVERKEPGDFIITPGFREYLGPDKMTDGACCPVIRPGG